MKKLMVILIVGCVLVVSQGLRKVATADEGIPARKLVGTYAETVHGSFFFCFENTSPFPPAKCGSAGTSGVSLNALAIGAYTSDDQGACVTWTETDTEAPESAAPPTVYVVHQTAESTNYDPTTGTGDGVFTNYFGGTCNGSTFDSTGATAVATGTYHYVASNNGKRIDSVVTSLTNSVGAFGGFSISATALLE